MSQAVFGALRAFAAASLLLLPALPGCQPAMREAGVRSASLRSAAVRTRAFGGHRLEPSDPVVLHGAGQSDESSFADYTQAMGEARPMLTMSYLDLRDDIPGYFARLHAELGRYNDLLIPQIGLSLNRGSAATHYEAETARGLDDNQIAALCDGLRSLDRPAFLRIGYEFNGSWNGYEPGAYIAAFRRVTGKLRACGLENVATVWDWSPDAEVDAENGGAAAADAAVRWTRFYPGDQYVDWWGLNLFTSASITSEATEKFLSTAEARKFPVMIAESTPRGHSVSGGQQAIDAWFAPYFGLIRSSPAIRAFCYINWNWAGYPQWADWGDARLQTNPAVLAFYESQVSSRLYASARAARPTLRLLRAHSSENAAR